MILPSSVGVVYIHSVNFLNLDKKLTRASWDMDTYYNLKQCIDHVLNNSRLARTQMKI